MTFRPLNRTELPSARGLDQSFSYAAPLALLTAVVATPFLPVDFPNPRVTARPAIQFEQAAFPSFLVTGTKPFLQSDWPVPKGYRRNPQFENPSTPAFLLKGVEPFVQLDWPVPKGPRPLPVQFDAASPLALTNEIYPFAQTSWPNPVIATKAIVQYQQGSLPSYLNTGTEPFYQLDWPVPKGARPISIQFEYAQFLALVPAAPFAEADWPVPKGYTRNPQFENLSTPAFLNTGAQPFSLLDWPIPKGARPLPVQFEYSNYKGLVTLVPFTPIDFPNPRGAQRLAPLQFELATPLPLPKLYPPFYRTDWPNPRGPLPLPIVQPDINGAILLPPPVNLPYDHIVKFIGNVGNLMNR